MTHRRYQIPCYGSTRYGYELDVESMVTLFEASEFDAVPDGWRHDPARTGRWKAHDGRLTGEAADGRSATVLWFEQPIRGDHAIAYRATISPADYPKASGALEGQDFAQAPTAPLPGEILAYWNGDGRTSGSTPWSLVLGALDGWPGGYSGLMYLTSRDGESYEQQGTVISRAFDVTGTTFDVFAGRLNQIDFLFGARVDAGGKAAQPSLVGQAILAKSGMTRPDCHRKKDNFVAIGTSAFCDTGVRLSVERLAVYQIPEAAVSDWR
jgi:hypothetical protein